MQAFADLAASRRDWIEQVLKPWCVQASAKELRQAEQEWGDIAGRVDPAATLWKWAWSRFPALVHKELAGLNETHAVRVALHDGSSCVGYPDSVLLGRASAASRTFEESPPISIDDIASVERVT
jgi:hypothetical protein